MHTLKIIGVFTLLFCLNGFAQAQFSIDFRVEKQSMSTPMSSLDEIFFLKYYYAKPVNVNFNGEVLRMYYDNGSTFVKKEVAEVNRSTEIEDGIKIMQTILYTDKANVSDTISFITDYQVGYVQVILPAKNSKGDYIGYTSYRQFTNNNQLALK